MSGLDASVVIPTRNRWALLQPGLASALGQEDVELEVIVVDDGSTDETPERLAALSDPRLRALRHETSLGVAPARNRGIAEARGRWVAFLDDDDVWAPRKLRTQIDAAEGADAAFAYAGAIHHDAGGHVIQVELAPDPSALRERLLLHNAIPAGSSNMIVRADLLAEIGGFDERLFQLADWELWFRLACAARGAAVAELLVGYLKHAANMLLERERDLFKELDYIAAKHPDPSGWRRAGVALSRWIGQNHLRAGRRGEAARAYARGARAYRSPTGAALAAWAVASPVAVRVSRRPVRGAIATPPAWLEHARARRP